MNVQIKVMPGEKRERLGRMRVETKARASDKNCPDRLTQYCTLRGLTFVTPSRACLSMFQPGALTGENYSLIYKTGKQSY